MTQSWSTDRRPRPRALSPRAINAVHGNAICATASIWPSPRQALPSVRAAGGFWIVTLTRTVELFELIAGQLPHMADRRDIGVRNERQRYWPPVEVAENSGIIHSKTASRSTVLRQREFRLGRLHHLTDLEDFAP